MPLGLRLAWAGSLPLLLLLREEEERELPAHDRHPFPASPSLSTLPNSRHTFHDVKIRGSRRPLAPALYPPAIHALRGVDRGRIRGLGLERVALVDVAVALALAPLPIRGQEGVSMGGGHRPRHALLVVAHAVSGRGLLTATAPRRGSSRSRRDRSRSSDRYRSRRDRSRREWSQSFDRYRSRRERARSPARRGERRDRSRSHALPGRSRDHSRSSVHLPASPACLRTEEAGRLARREAQEGVEAFFLSASCGFWSGGGCYSCCRRDIHGRAPVCYAGTCQVLFELVWLLFPGSNWRVCGCDRFCSSVGGSRGSLFVGCWSGHNLCYGCDACWGWRFACCFRCGSWRVW